MCRFVASMIVILSAFVIVGCASGTLSIERYVVGEESTGIVYALPETVVVVSVPFTVKTSLRYNNRKYINKGVAELGNVTVVTSTAPDWNNVFEIDTSLTDAATWKNSFSVTLNENMTLSKSAITTEDAILAATKDVLGTLANVASLFRDGSGDAPADVVKEIDRLIAVERKTREALYALMTAAATSDPDAAELKRVEARRALLEKNLDFAKQRLAKLRIKHPREFKVIVLCKIDLSDPTTDFDISTSNCPQLKAAYEQFEGVGVKSVKLPQTFTFAFSQEPAPRAPAAYDFNYPKTPGQDSEEAKPTNAYIYRIPWVGRYTIHAKPAANSLVAEGPITVAQLGSFGRIHIDSPRFAKHVSDIEFHADTGGIKLYKSTRESSAASNAATGIDSIFDTIEEARKKPTETEILEAENKLLEAQKKQIELQRELAELLDGEETE